MTYHHTFAQAIADDYNTDPDRPHILVVTHSVTVAEVLVTGQQWPQIMTRCTGDPSVWQIAGLLAAGKVDIDRQLAEALAPDGDE